MLNMICICLWSVAGLVSCIASASILVTKGIAAATPLLIAMLVSFGFVMYYRGRLEIRKDKEP